MNLMQPLQTGYHQLVCDGDFASKCNSERYTGLSVPLFGGVTAYWTNPKSPRQSMQIEESS